MSTEFDRLSQEVTETTGVIDSAILFIGAIAQKLRDAQEASNPAAITALADELDAKANALAAAIAANP